MPFTKLVCAEPRSSLGRTPTYVDFSAEPVINADNPPDLKNVVDNANSYEYMDMAAAAPTEACGKDKGGKTVSETIKRVPQRRD
jgi:hypothetical protein